MSYGDTAATIATTGQQNGLARVSYPFLNAQTKDTTTKQYEADFLITPSAYAPAAALSTWPGDAALSANTSAYLVEESAPDTGMGVYSVRRKYSTIPGTQTNYSSRWFIRPDMSGLKSGSSYFASYDNGKSTHKHTSRKAVQGSSITQGKTVGAALPSTNITCTDSGAHTATFAANATKATIDAQLANLTSLIAPYSVTDGSNLTIYWRTQVGTSMTSITAAAATVDIKTLNGSCFITALGNTTTADLTLLYCPSHGASVGEKCGLWNGDTLVHTGSVAGVTDSNNITILISDMSSPDFNITHATFAASASVRYANGSKMVRVKEVKEFYLPTITGGISTYADIPVVTTYTSPQSWADQIVAASTYVAIDSGNVEQWAGPIYYRETVSCLMSSAVESLPLV